MKYKVIKTYLSTIVTFDKITSFHVNITRTNNTKAPRSTFLWYFPSFTNKQRDRLTISLRENQSTLTKRPDVKRRYYSGKFTLSRPNPKQGYKSLAHVSTAWNSVALHLSYFKCEAFFMALILLHIPCYTLTTEPCPHRFHYYELKSVIKIVPLTFVRNILELICFIVFMENKVSSYS